MKILNEIKEEKIMPTIIIHHDKITDPQILIDICPFGAFELENGKLEINAACRLCKICIQKGPEGVCEFKEDEIIHIDKNEWKGIAVYVEHSYGNCEIHPVTYELIGKAKELAKKINHPVYCLFIGGTTNIEEITDSLLKYGIDEIFIYNYSQLEHYRIEPYAACFEDFINKIKPSTILVGGTTVGRSLAPRVAARFTTGLTADCTILDMQENTDLDQIRPAFGGNIMAHIRTPNHRPQFATVRYKIFNAPEPCDNPSGKITTCEISQDKLKSSIEVIKIKSKEKVKSIEDAEYIVVAGRGIKKQEDLDLIRKLADSLDAQIATTRPLIEAGWADPRKQIGLSGRTVKPKLIITCGVSGSIQFRAGMSGSETIIAINIDKNARIFDIAHYGIIGDLYKIIPLLIQKIKTDKKNFCN